MKRWNSRWSLCIDSDLDAAVTSCDCSHLQSVSHGWQHLAWKSTKLCFQLTWNVFVTLKDNFSDHSSVFILRTQWGRGVEGLTRPCNTQPECWCVSGSSLTLELLSHFDLQGKYTGKVKYITHPPMCRIWQWMSAKINRMKCNKKVHFDSLKNQFLSTCMQC